MWCLGLIYFSPYFSSAVPQPADMEMAAYGMQLWKEKVRFIGAGTIGIAAIWTLITLFKPMMEGMRLSFRAFSGKADVSARRTEQDLSPKSMILWTLGMMVLLAFSFYHFIEDAGIPAGLGWLLVVVCTLLTSLTLFCGSAVISVASISNDNLQDLKTGYLVQATPWRQQIALIIGCIVGAVVIAPVLEILYEAYGFTGAMPREGMDASQALAAPQATLMTTIAQGIFAHNLQWTYIFTGVAIGVALIIVDFVLKKSSASKLSLPVLAVGMGIYLPPSINMPIIIGAVLAAVLKNIVRKRYPNDTESRLKKTERAGTLFAAGLIVGESLIGVMMAFIIAASVTGGGSDAPLALNLDNWQGIAAWLGLAAFIAGILIFAKRVLKSVRN